MTYQKYTKNISKLIYSVINIYLITRGSCDIPAKILNFIFLHGRKGIKLSNMSVLYQTSYIFVNYMFPIFIEYIKVRLTYHKGIMRIYNIIEVIVKVINIGYTYKYIFHKSFVYDSVLGHIFRIMIVNYGQKDLGENNAFIIGRQFNLFLLFTLIKFGEWYYNTSINHSVSNQIAPIEKPPITSENNSIEKNKCLICLKYKFCEPVACRLCGFVFCKNCITSYLKTSRKCFYCLNTVNEDSSKAYIKIYQ